MTRSLVSLSLRYVTRERCFIMLCTVKSEISKILLSMFLSLFSKAPSSALA